MIFRLRMNKKFCLSSDSELVHLLVHIFIYIKNEKLLKNFETFYRNLT